LNRGARQPKVVVERHSPSRHANGTVVTVVP
jgi:hypothetical protein